MKRIMSWSFFFFLFIVGSATEITQVKFDLLNVDDGLSQNTVDKIFQDSRGLIWIATRDGVNIYDGLTFQTLRNNRNDSTSLINNWVSAVAEAPDGKIWIGSIGLNIYDPVTDKLSRVPVGSDENSFHGGRVHDIEVDNDKTIWIASVNGLVHYFPETDTYKTYRSDQNDPTAIRSNIIMDVEITVDNQVFIAPEMADIYKFNRRAENFSPIHYKEDNIYKNYSKNLKEGPDGKIYITAEFNCLYIYNPRTNQTEKIDTEKGLSINSIKSEVLFINSREIWLGTDGAGVNIYNTETKEFKYLSEDTKDSYSLHGNSILDLFRDRDGNIWVGHFGTGISLMRKYKNKFHSFYHNPFDINTLNNGVICSIFEDSYGTVWCGLDGGGLCRYNEKDNSFTRFFHNPDDETSIVNDVILSIQENPQGQLLLGTFAGGFMVFDQKSEKVVKTFTDDDGSGLSGPNIWKILPDSKGRYWLNVLGKGVDMYNPLTGEIKEYAGQGNNKKICSNVVMTSAEGPDGRIWFGARTSGLCILNPENDDVEVKSFNEDDANSLSNNDVKSIIFIDDIAWIGTNGGGLNRYDIKKDSFKIYTTEQGLSSNSIMGILVDNKGQLWLSSTKGLMKFNPKTEEVVAYDKSQGIQGNEFKYNSQAVLEDGRMMFGGSNGLTVFHPDSIKPSPVNSKLIFTNLKVLNNTAEIGSENSILKKHLNYTNNLTLKHKHRAFSIEFASLDFTSPEKNKYKYKLEGFDEDWVEVGTRNFASYTNLKAGLYTFKLKGSNSDGIWSNNVRTISIRVRPAWYQTKLFIFSVIVLTILLIYFLYKRRMQQIKHDREILQNKIKEGEKVIAAKVNEIEIQKEEIKNREKNEFEMRYQTEGIAKFSDIISNNRKDVTGLTSIIISELVTYVGADVGMIYLKNDNDPENIALVPNGQINKINDDEKLIKIGEGYVGACFLEKATIEVNNLPDQFILLQSGLGGVSLKNCLYIPIIQDANCLGIIELASLNSIEKYKIAFVEKIAETYGSVLAITISEEKTKEMLEQNRMQSEELLAQEEEMRQNIEEMQATQEESTRKEAELIREIERYKQKVQTAI